MGREIFSRIDYHRTRTARGIDKDTHVTRVAEQEARRTGKLRPSVDPSVDRIRRSLMRFEPLDDGTFRVTVGCPMTIETITDTTGSMGDNVDIAMKNLPETYGYVAEMLKGYDPHLALGIFGDVVDDFVLQRPQFEMTAQKLVDYLKDMVPEHGGGDSPEDPHYGLFAAAYLTSAYVNHIGLKTYHFLVTDATAHERFSYDTFVRIFGSGFLDSVHENGFENLTKESLSYLTIPEVVRDLKQRAHAFALIVGGSGHTRSFWEKIYGEDNVIMMGSTEYLPQVQAAIVGLTEGTLEFRDVASYLRQHQIVPRSVAEALATELGKINLKAQAVLRHKIEQSGHRIPRAGDIFESKTDLWPVNVILGKNEDEDW